MKFSDGSLASSASSRFGQFSIQKTGDPGGEKVCSYNKRTFFSWTVHCLRFRFSAAYRESVMEERREILGALHESCQGQTISASDGSHGSSENMRYLNVMLSSRRRFNSRVSVLLQLNVASAETDGVQTTTDGVQAETGEPQAMKGVTQTTTGVTQATKGVTQVTAQRNLLNHLILSRHNKADIVLRPQDELGDRDTIKRKGAVPPYVLQFVEDSLEAGYVANTPNHDGPDKNGELCKRFLTYHTFVSEPKGELEENLFKWKAVNTKFDPSQAYPRTVPADLPGEGWHLRTPSDSSIKYAAEIADAVRGMTKGDAVEFAYAEALDNKDDAEKHFIAMRFGSFLGYNLGNDLLLQDSAI